MGTFLLVSALVIYSVWTISRIYAKKKNNRSKCDGCPYQKKGCCR